MRQGPTGGVTEWTSRATDQKIGASDNWASQGTVPRLYFPENLISRELLILRGAPWTPGSVYSALPIEARGWRSHGHY